MRTIQEIGEELRTYRLEHNINLENVINEMRISKTTFDKIEKGEYSESNARARMLYKKYIEKLGLDYSSYEEDIKFIFPNHVEETINLSQEEILEKIKVKKKFKISKKLISSFIVIIFLIILIPFTMYNFNHQVVDNKVINESTLLKDTVLEPMDVIEAPIPEVSVKRDSTITNQVNVYLEDLKNINVKLVAKGDSYYDYETTDTYGMITYVEQGNLKEKDEKSFVIEDGAKGKLNIGNLSNVQIFINEFDITAEIKDLGTQNYIYFKEKDEEN